jgi:hypothetical protein
VALKAGVKIFDGAANSLDFESVYKHSEPRPGLVGSPPAALAVKVAR